MCVYVHDIIVCVCIWEGGTNTWVHSVYNVLLILGSVTSISIPAIMKGTEVQTLSVHAWQQISSLLADAL